MHYEACFSRLDAANRAKEGSNREMTRGAVRCWLLCLAVLALWPPGCLGGQTGDPGVVVACGSPTAGELFDEYQGEYSAAAVHAFGPSECRDADTHLVLKVVRDLGRRRASACAGEDVLVEVALASDDGLDHRFQAWLSPGGGLEPSEGQRLDPMVEWQGNLVLDPSNGSFALVSPTLSTLPRCCEDPLVFTTGAAGAAGAAGSAGYTCP